MIGIDETVALVKMASSAEQGWARLVALCERLQPSPLWKELPEIDVSADVRAAAAWLTQQLGRRGAPRPASGLYLGLDTLNMAGDDGHNVELGATKQADPAELDPDWVWECEWYGEKHLIVGLHAMNAVYLRPEWEQLYSFADYVLPLGYSGLVLAEALGDLAVTHPLLAAWGFHDGDLFFLARRTPRTLERICEVF